MARRSAARGGVASAAESCVRPCSRAEPRTVETAASTDDRRMSNPVGDREGGNVNTNSAPNRVRLLLRAISEVINQLPKRISVTGQPRPAGRTGDRPERWESVPLVGRRLAARLQS